MEAIESILIIAVLFLITPILGALMLKYIFFLIKWLKVFP